MKRIYLIERTDACDYDEFDAVVVFAKTPKEAKSFAINGYYGSFKEGKTICKLIGVANNNQAYGEVLASFKAG